jgi:hypothetical protein
MFDRDKVINVLIEDDIYCIMENGCVDYLYDILDGGHTGYRHYSDFELMRECDERDISYLVGDNDDIEEV